MRPLLFFIILLFLFDRTVNATQSSITEAEGNACLRDYKSRTQTEQAALIDAKKRAVEFVSTYIKSETNVRNFEVEEDNLTTYANAEVKLLKELEKAWYKDAIAGDCYKIKIKATIIPNLKTKDTKYADYDLQERCGKSAAQLFSNKYSMFDDNEFSIARHKSHYNSKLNKCIMSVEIISIVGVMSGKKDDQLIDVNENKLLGNSSFVPGLSPMCFISGQDDIKSVSATDWIAFVNKIMRE